MSDAYRKLFGPDTSASYRSKPVSGQVASVNTENDTMRVDAGSTGTPTTGIPHGYSGPNSWMRFYPEPGTGVILQERAEDRSFIATGYYRNADSTEARDATDAEIPANMRRKMYVGEWELSSIGQGQAYADRRGNLEFRAGLMRLHVNQDRLETSSYAGTHIREVSGRTIAVGSGLNDQERFGLIKRSPVNVAFETYFGGPDAPTATSPFQNGATAVWGKEYVRNISTRPTSSAPSVLPIVDHREGTTVVNDLGQPDLVPIPTLPTPVKGPFRFRSRWYVLPNASTMASAPYTSLDVGMDLAGNVGVSLPIAGNLIVSVAGGQGGAIDFVAANRYGLTVGAQGIKTVTSGPSLHTAQMFQFTTSEPSLPVARVSDTVSIDLAILATAIAPLLHDSNQAPLVPVLPGPVSVVAGTIATGNANHLG